ncbi:hypothetical protein N0V90_006849 [Kalmusia sp. IMI 367209]|nr:hypothetical protein N0V90_006849 [Kalmusia sp. IMI 367209]
MSSGIFIIAILLLIAYKLHHLRNELKSDQLKVDILSTGKALYSHQYPTGRFDVIMYKCSKHSGKHSDDIPSYDRAYGETHACLIVYPDQDSGSWIMLKRATYLYGDDAAFWALILLYGDLQIHLGSLVGRMEQGQEFPTDVEY